MRDVALDNLRSMFRIRFITRPLRDTQEASFDTTDNGRSSVFLTAKCNVCQLLLVAIEETFAGSLGLVAYCTLLMSL